MATLISGYNPQYSENASILTGNPNRVTVEVEDSIDKEFWKDLLMDLCPEKEYHFDPYHTVLKDEEYQRNGKGKDQIIKNSHGFNEWHIGCVDSDYDWLLSDYTEYGKTISASKYLLQTYAYSIENLICLPSTLGDFCREITEEELEFDFEDYIRKLSQIVFPLLAWSVYLYSKDNHEFTPKAWRPILITGITDIDHSLEIIEHRVNEKLDEFNKKYASEMAEFEKMTRALLTEKAMTSENAYLFVRGHELFDHLANIVLRTIIPQLRQQHYSALQAIEGEERVIALQAYHAKDTSIVNSLKKNYRYKGKTSIYNKIKADVLNIWN